MTSVANGALNHNHLAPNGVGNGNGAAGGHNHMSTIPNSTHTHEIIVAIDDPIFGTGPSLGAPASRQNFYQSQSASFRTFGNPAPLGLFALASTLLVWSLVNVRTDHVTTPNIVVALASAFGGLILLLAGMWEFAVGNTLGATVFSAYGGFWLSYAAIFIPTSGILEAYTSSNELSDAFGFYLASWFIVTFLIFIGSLRSNIALIMMFFFFTMMFLLLTIAQYRENAVGIAKAGGAFGIVTAFIAYYKALSNLLSPGVGFFTLPLVPVARPKSY